MSKNYYLCYNQKQLETDIISMESDIKNHSLYRHFKGGLYEIIGIAKHSETLEELVVYRAQAHPEKLWVRPKAEFFEEIEYDGMKIRRFSPENKSTKSG